MIIKEAEFTTCDCCGTRKRVSEEEYGCDNCGKPIELYDDQALLRLRLFWHDGRGSNGDDTLHLCSWKCALQKASTLSTDYFIDLPYLSFDEPNSERNAAAFWQAVREFGSEAGQG